MSKVNRNEPKRSKASESRYSIMEFEREFPDDAACLDYLVKMLYPFGIDCPTCKEVTKHYRRKGRTSYSCEFCGHDEYPMAGTIFQDSATSLKLWFYAIHLMASTRCGISAKQLEREIGVTYKTAWRMFHKIRSLLPQDLEQFEGTVEMDEAYIGGRGHWRHGPQKSGRPGRDDPYKTPVFGMVQRGANGKKGKVMAKVTDVPSESTLLPHIMTKVLPPTTVYTSSSTPTTSLAATGTRTPAFTTRRRCM
jgi:transposase-like protein